MNPAEAQQILNWVYCAETRCENDRNEIDKLGLNAEQHTKLGLQSKKRKQALYQLEEFLVKNTPVV